MNNVIFTNFGDSDPCCNIGDIWVQCDNPAKAEVEWKEAEKYRWHDLRADSNDLPEVYVNYKHSFSDNVLVLRDGWDVPLVSYINLSTKEWFDSSDDENVDNVIMWKYIKIPDESSVVNETGED